MDKGKKGCPGPTRANLQEDWKTITSKGGEGGNCVDDLKGHQF